MLMQLGCLEIVSYVFFFDKDVGKVFGIPCGPRKIDGDDAQVTENAIGFMHASLGLVEKDAHSLKRIEAFLMKDLFVLFGS